MVSATGSRTPICPASSSNQTRPDGSTRRSPALALARGIGYSIQPGVRLGVTGVSRGTTGVAATRGPPPDRDRTRTPHKDFLLSPVTVAHEPAKPRALGKTRFRA